jgi:transcriptional regulator with XRE-family HTH domain
MEIYLPSNIRCLRQRRNWSQEELALQVGLNRGNIASYENGTAEPKICNLLKLSHLFGVSIIALTQEDFSKKEITATQFKSASPSPSLATIQKEANQLSEVMKSLHTCCIYKKATLHEISKDAQIIMMHFEQLYEASQHLLDKHLQLIQFLEKKST